MEIENAVNQAKKELANRFDFKGSKAEITLDKKRVAFRPTDFMKTHSEPVETPPEDWRLLRANG